MCEDFAAEMEEFGGQERLVFGRSGSQVGIDHQDQAPGGGEVGLYQPKHPTALHLA